MLFTGLFARIISGSISQAFFVRRVLNLLLDGVDGDGTNADQRVSEVTASLLLREREKRQRQR